MLTTTPFLRLFSLFWVAIGLNASAYSDAPVLQFNRDVRPILSKNCFACHGFDEKSRQAELRLDLPEAAYTSRDGLAPITPKDLGKSSVWQRITTVDPDDPNVCGKKGRIAS